MVSSLTSEMEKREDHHSFPSDSLRVDCVDGGTKRSDEQVRDQEPLLLPSSPLPLSPLLRMIKRPEEAHDCCEVAE